MKKCRLKNCPHHKWLSLFHQVTRYNVHCHLHCTSDLICPVEVWNWYWQSTMKSQNHTCYKGFIVELPLHSQCHAPLLICKPHNEHSQLASCHATGHAHNYVASSVRIFACSGSLIDFAFLLQDIAGSSGLSWHFSNKTRKWYKSYC